MIWSGYTAYEANKDLASQNSLRDEFNDYSLLLDENLENPTSRALRGTDKRRIDDARRALGIMAFRWDPPPYTKDEIKEHINQDISYSTNRLTVAIYAILAAALPPLLYPIFLWVLAGFQKRASNLSEAPQSRRTLRKS
jgi:hypothetical protein